MHYCHALTHCIARYNLLRIILLYDVAIYIIYYIYMDYKIIGWYSHLSSVPCVGHYPITIGKLPTYIGLYTITRPYVAGGL